MFPIALLVAALAQAEPAPPSVVPGPASAGAPPHPAGPVREEEEEEEEPLRTSVGFCARLAHRRDGSGEVVPPTLGFSLGIVFERRFLDLGTSGVSLGAAADLFYDQFTRGVSAGGSASDLGATRFVSQTTFVLQGAIGRRWRLVRPFAGFGAGLSVGFFSTPEVQLRPGTARSLQPLLRAAIGVEIYLRFRTTLLIRADGSRMLTRPVFRPTTGEDLRVFGDLVDVGVGIAHRF